MNASFLPLNRSKTALSAVFCYGIFLVNKPVNFGDHRGFGGVRGVEGK